MSPSPFVATDPALFFSKKDSLDPRLGDFVRALPDSSSSLLREHTATEEARRFVLAGYPDDEGIALNGGRIGASLAPRCVRRHLYKMTPSPLSLTSQPRLFDLGDLQPGPETLGERHQRARHTAAEVLRTGAVWLAIGGGHDYGFADAAGFADVCAERGVRPLIINFDAHLDVRPYQTSAGEPRYSSGTPFSRYLDAFPDSDFAEIGLQGQCNSRSHLDWLTERGGRSRFLEQQEASGRAFAIDGLEFLGDWTERRRPAFISVDIDAFSFAFAPGCSQSFATGLTPGPFFALFQILLKRLDVQALAIYEVSPPLDEGEKTSRLAAQILHRAIFPL